MSHLLGREPACRALAAIAAGWTIAAPVPAPAHEFWLAPSSYQAATGDTIAIGAFVGTCFRGERRPFSSRRVVRLELRGAARRDLLPPGFDGEIDVARFVVADDGGVVVAYQSNHAAIELPAEQFDEYLRAEGLEGPLAARARLGGAAGPGRERYARCAKTWIPGHDAARVTKAVGHPLELVPLGDPARAQALAVRVVHRGRPLAGALVRAWKQSLAGGGLPTDAAARDSAPACFETRSDRRGVAVVHLDGDGEWLVNAVHMVASPTRTGAGWESLWASLTFARISSSVPGSKP